MKRKYHLGMIKDPQPLQIIYQASVERLNIFFSFMEQHHCNTAQMNAIYHIIDLEICADGKANSRQPAYF